jgi:C4-dicarboxylate-binding protein DctP
VKLQAILIGVLAVVFSSTAVAQQPIVIKFSHVVSPDAPKGRAAEKFAQLAAQYTNGQVKVEVYPGSRLYGTPRSSLRCGRGGCRCWPPRSAR